MKIKSAKFFRKNVWLDPQGGNGELSVDYDFVGSFAGTGKETRHGFFKLYHGIKPDIAAFLPSLLKIAEDAQAIYEFLQNAVDCGSTHFYIYYDDDYFLAINNGVPFEEDGLKSVINIAQTTKKSCDKIGRFGVGFKLVHRLVGKSEGIHELVNEFKGPILFSWSKAAQLLGLLDGQILESIEAKGENDEEYNCAPYLLKLILTNFPAAPDEVVKDLSYNDRVMFSNDELNSLRTFVSEKLNSVGSMDIENSLSQGTLFFLKLGQDKKTMLDRDRDDLKKGVQYSMNLLKKLENVYINDEEINREELLLESFYIEKNSPEFDMIDPEYKDCNIKFTIGFPPIKFGDKDAYDQIYEIKSSPNFYKYFPMGDETNGFGIIIHCDSFSNEVNRRKLQKDNTNKHLFPHIGNYIISRLKEYLVVDREKYLQLYASLILSDVPNKQNNDWLLPIFFTPILQFLRQHIPTANNGVAARADLVKINKLKIEIDLVDFGLGQIQWFQWNNTLDLALLQEAINTEKIGLQTWDIRDLIENGDINCINNWIARQNPTKYQEFISEIENSDLRIATKKRIAELKIFRFSNRLFYSVLELKNYNNLLLHTRKTFKIKTLLEKIGLVTSEREISVSKNILSAVIEYLPKDVDTYQMIALKCKTNSLNPAEKKELFQNLIHEETKFDNIGLSTLQNLVLFSASQKVLLPINKLAGYHIDSPNWLNNYKIDRSEYFTELDDYLLSEDAFYGVLIRNNWVEIMKEIVDPTAFYQKVKHYYSLNEENTQFKNEPYIYVDAEIGFRKPDEILYNQKYLQIERYGLLRSAILDLTGYFTPEAGTLAFLSQPPFKTDSSNILDYFIKDDKFLDLEQSIAVLSFCQTNNEHFFQHYTIIKNETSYQISSRDEGSFQVRVSSRETKELIYEQFTNNLYLLPYELDAFRDEPGILFGERLYDEILDNIDIDANQQILFKIIKHEGPKRKLIEGLTEIRFVHGKSYALEDHIITVLILIWEVIGDLEYELLRKKIVIEDGEKLFKLSELPPFSDSITFLEKTFSLVKILPENYLNGDYVVALLGELNKIGISGNKIKKLFGINDDLEPSDVFTLLQENYPLLKNGYQIAFLLYYNQLEAVDFRKFTVSTLDQDYNLNYSYYIIGHNYISNSAVLAPNYKDLSEILTLPFSFGLEDNLILLETPAIDVRGFNIPYLEKDLNDVQRLTLIEDLFSLHNDNLSLFLAQNWEIIGDYSTKDVLGFSPKMSVYPNSVARIIERLPDYLSNWAESTPERLSFLQALGVWVIGSTIVDLRSFLLDSGSFYSSRIAQDFRLNEDESMLLGTLEWIKEMKLELDQREEYEILDEMIRVININRESGYLQVERKYDFDLLSTTSVELSTNYYQNWSQSLERQFNIYIYPGEMPIMVNLNNISEHIFYRTNQGNICIKNDRDIFINEDCNIQDALSSLIILDNSFNASHLLLLYQSQNPVLSKSDEIDHLRDEVERLKQIIANLTRVSAHDKTNATINTDVYYDEIKVDSETYLNDFLIEKFPTHKVKWLNFDESMKEFVESYENHDFEIVDDKGAVLHFIDCKGTPLMKKTFYMTINEWEFFLSCLLKGDNYQIYRVFNCATLPEFVCIDDLWRWIKYGRVVPYLIATETIAGGKVFLTIT